MAAGRCRPSQAPHAFDDISRTGTADENRDIRRDEWRSNRCSAPASAGGHGEFNPNGWARPPHGAAAVPAGWLVSIHWALHRHGIIPTKTAHLDMPDPGRGDLDTFPNEARGAESSRS